MIVNVEHETKQVGNMVIVYHNEMNQLLQEMDSYYDEA